MSNGLLCLLFAILGFLSGSVMYSAIIAPVLGHAVGMFSNFKGGKCISTIFGVMIALVWVCPELFILAGIYVVTCLLPGINSNRTCSIIAFSCFLVVAFIVEATAGRIFIAIGCSLCALISIVRHLQSKEGNVDEQLEID